MKCYEYNIKNTTRESIIKFIVYLSIFIFSIFSRSFLWVVLLFSPGVYAEEDIFIIPDVNLHSKKNGKNQIVQPAITHISRQAIENSPVIRLAELLKQEQSVARIETHSGDSTQIAVSLRGFGDNAGANSLILIDGFPLTNPSLLAPNFNSLLLADIERIDIIQGSAGTLWGDQAVGGVINIITRQPHKRMIEGKIGMGNENTHFYSLLAGNQFSHGVFLKLSGFSNQTNHYRMHNQQKDEDIFSEIGMNYSHGLIDIRFQYSHDTIYFPGGLTEEQYIANPVQATNFSNFSHYHIQSVQLLNKHTINAEWLLETHLSHQDMSGNGFIGVSFDRHEWVNLLGVRLIGTIANTNLILGYDKQSQYYQFENRAVQKKSVAQQDNLYTQAIVPVYHHVHLTLGARSAWQYSQFQAATGDVHDPSDHVFVTEQGLNFSPNPNWQFFLRRDGNFRFPKANEELWHPANVSSLRIQKGVSYETGGSWQTNNQKIQLTIYQLVLNNEIAFDPIQTASSPFGSFHHFDQTTRDGITIAENYQLNPIFALNTQINYVNARFASGQYKGNWIPAVPAWNANIGLNYQLTSYWNASYTALYTGGRFPSEDEENIGKKLPAYWLNNVALQYTLPVGKVSFEIANIGNQRYSTYTLYQPATRSNTYYPGAGRSYLLTVAINM